MLSTVTSVCVHLLTTFLTVFILSKFQKDFQFWNDCTCTKKAEKFFLTSILPELLGKWYTRPYELAENKAESDESLTSSSKADSSETFCYCKGIEGEMIACDNAECAVEWFHTRCLLLCPKESGTVLIVGNSLAKANFEGYSVIVYCVLHFVYYNNNLNTN